MSKNYGFIITETPGQIEAGTYPVTREAIKAGNLCRSAEYNVYAIFESQQGAEEAMNKLVPAGSTPTAYAGLRVEPAYPYIISTLYSSSYYVGMNGWIAPIV